MRFEFGGFFGTAEQLLLVPMLALAPLPFVPLLVGRSPARRHGARRRSRDAGTASALVGPLADCWFVHRPRRWCSRVLAPGTPSLGDAEFYALAFVAQVGGRLRRGRCSATGCWTPSARASSRPSRIGTPRVDAILLPLAFLITLAAVEEPGPC